MANKKSRFSAKSTFKTKAAHTSSTKAKRGGKGKRSNAWRSYVSDAPLPD